MKKRYLLGLDAGGSGARCLLVDADSGESLSSFQSWVHPADRTADLFSFRFDTERNWRIIGRAVRSVLTQSGCEASDIAGVAATGMRFGLVILDREGREIFATPNRDARAASQSSELARERGEELQRLSGCWPAPIHAASRLIWLAARKPQLLERARWALSISDWMAFRLCGEAAADHTQAPETLLADINSSEWSAEAIASLGLPREIFPGVYQPGTRLGVVTEEAEAELGLKAGTPVAVGGADTQCSLLGGGVLAPGGIGIIAGTTAPIQLVLEAPRIDETVHLWTGRHVTGAAWVFESNAGPIGEALEWTAAAFFEDSAYGLSPVARLMGEVAAAPLGAGGLLSTVGAQVFDARALKLPIGHIMLSHLTTEKSEARSRTVRAVVEGMAYALKANVEQLVLAAGGEPSDSLLAGGMSRSPLWCQIVSDVLERELRVPTTSLASALGAAICAGVAAGVFASLEEGARELSRTERRHRPERKSSDEYRELYAGWQQLREARAEADDGAAELAVQAMATESAREASSGPDGVVRTEVQGGSDFRPRIFVTADMDESALVSLSELGEVEYAPFRKEMNLLSGPDLVDALAGFQVFVTEVDVLDAEAMRELEELRVVGICRSNPVNVDVRAATARGISVLHTPGRNASAVADLTLAFMLMLPRRLPEASAFLGQPGIEAGDSGRMGQAFVSFRGSELWRKTVGLVGWGSVGRAVTERLLPFGVRLLVYDPYIEGELAARRGAQCVDLETLLRESDFVSLHAPAGDETEGLIGAGEFSIMKPGAFLINTARAALVDEAELVAALKSGRLGGAAIDVFSVEPPGSDHPLLAFPNVIATPHLGGNTVEVAAHQGAIIAEDLRRLLKGEAPHHIVNPETLPRFRWKGQRENPDKEVLDRLAAETALPAPAVSDLHRQRPITAETGGEVRPSPLMRIVERFVERVLSDTAIKEFSRRRSVTMHFVISDFDLEFHLAFSRGQVTGGMGWPDQRAEVLLKMTGDTLDGIFTGRLNPTRAALSGKISFTGDTVKAIAFQRIQKDLKRLYAEAREEIGDPGDLSGPDEASIGRAAIGRAALGRAAIGKLFRQQASTVQSPSDRPGHAGPTRSKIGDIRDEIVDALAEMYATGLITSTGGNISARADGGSGEIYITPGQIFKASVEPSMMVRLDRDGTPVEPGSLSPSSERLMHCAIYRTRPDVEAVIHSHPLNATMLAMAGLEFLPVSTEAALIGEIPCIPFIMPGTLELADAVSEAIGRGSAVLMKNHGLIVAAASLRRAADMTRVIEQSAQMIVTCHKLGKKPSVLPKDAVSMLRELDEFKA